ncbi:MAG: hypothetical protein Q9207_004169 [Kuettlingeria erythrocarpa]
MVGLPQDSKDHGTYGSWSAPKQPRYSNGYQYCVYAHLWAAERTTNNLLVLWSDHWPGGVIFARFKFESRPRVPRATTAHHLIHVYITFLLSLVQVPHWPGFFLHHDPKLEVSTSSDGRCNHQRIPEHNGCRLRDKSRITTQPLVFASKPLSRYLIHAVDPVLKTAIARWFVDQGYIEEIISIPVSNTIFSLFHNLISPNILIFLPFSYTIAEESDLRQKNRKANIYVDGNDSDKKGPGPTSGHGTVIRAKANFKSCDRVF